MLLKEIIHALESFAPPSLQESYDNAGLITGHAGMEITQALLTLDCTEEVIDEAITKNCNLVIAHHPIIFSGLKKINGNNYVERTIIKAIKHDVAIYAAHTNLDNVRAGVNQKICDKLGLKNTRILVPLQNRLMKLFTFCPNDHAEKVREALFAAGAGAIGNYDECSFNAEGYGTFRGNNKTKPFVGEKGKQHRETETKIEVIFPSWLMNKIVDALKQNHPYEEVAYDIVTLNNNWQDTGAGMIGQLEEPMRAIDFFNFLKQNMEVKTIRHTPIVNRQSPIVNVAVCGGAGSFLLQHAINASADIFITSDFKYHQFFDADNRIIIADIGHYESEQFTPGIFSEVLKQSFPTFAALFSTTNTNPINYF